MTTNTAVSLSPQPGGPDSKPGGPDGEMKDNTRRPTLTDKQKRMMSLQKEAESRAELFKVSANQQNTTSCTVPLPDFIEPETQRVCY